MERCRPQPYIPIHGEAHSAVNKSGPSPLLFLFTRLDCEREGNGVESEHDLRRWIIPPGIHWAK